MGDWVKYEIMSEVEIGNSIYYLMRIDDTYFIDEVMSDFSVGELFEPYTDREEAEADFDNITGMALAMSRD